MDRITKSHSLRGSESLCKLLQYLAKQSLDHPDAPLKEYQIATEVYGRSADFDPQSDSTIRVQAGRLRLKLAEYYASEGAGDPIVVKIPKGSYHLAFETRPAGPVPQIVPAREPSGPVPAQTVALRWRIAVVALLACLIVAVVVLASLLRTRQQAERGNRDFQLGPDGRRATRRILEAVQFGHRGTVGHLQQRGLCGAPRNGHALLQRARGLK